MLASALAAVLMVHTTTQAPPACGMTSELKVIAATKESGNAFRRAAVLLAQQGKWRAAATAQEFANDPSDASRLLPVYYALRSGHPDRADSLLRALTKQQRKSLAAHWVAAELALERSDPETAAEELEAARSAGTIDDEFLSICCRGRTIDSKALDALLRARVALLRGDVATSVRLLRKATTPEGRLFLARALRASGQTADAVRELKNLAREIPPCAGVWREHMLFEAALFASEINTTAAERLYREAIDAAEKQEEAFRAAAYEAEVDLQKPVTGLFVAAMRELRYAAPESRNNLGHLMIARADGERATLNEAKAQLSNASQSRDYTTPEYAYIGLARAELAAGKPEVAATEVMNALWRGPRQDEALDLARVLIRDAPEARLGLGVMYVAMTNETLPRSFVTREYGRELAQLDEVAATHDGELAHQFAAVRAYTTNNFERARELAKAALAESSSADWASAIEAATLVAIGRNEEAQTIFRALQRRVTLHPPRTAWEAAMLRTAALAFSAVAAGGDDPDARTVAAALLAEVARPVVAAGRPFPWEPWTGLTGSVETVEDKTVRSGAKVTVFAEDGPRTVTTDNRGRWRVRDLPAGAYSVIAEFAGMQSRGRVVNVATETEVALILHPRITRPHNFYAVGINAANLSGRIEDPSATPVSGATVTAHNLERNQTQTATTDEQGRFRFLLLPVGEYELTVSASGFGEYKQSPIPLGVGAALDIPVHLTVEENISIDVWAAVPLVETARTQVASSITREEVQDLPLNGRNYLDLAQLAPGASRTNTGVTQRFAETSAVPGTGISISTQRNLENSFIVDGLSANDDAADLAGAFFSQEVIREFAVIRAGGTAELGRASGGIINVVTHAGSNDVRGGTYIFARDDRFDAENALTSTKLPFERKQYGGTFGGPLLRDRTFLFGNAEKLGQKGSGVVTITPANVTAINARLDAINYPGVRLSTGPFENSLVTTNLFVRGDTISPADQLTLRVNISDVESENVRTTGGLSDVSRGTDVENKDRTLAGNNLWVVSDRTFSETRAQVTWSRLEAPPNDPIGPAVMIAGVASLGTFTNSPIERDIDIEEIVQNVARVQGSHVLKAGVDIRRNNMRIVFPGPVQGVYTYANLVNFQQGRYSTFQQAFGDDETEQQSTDFGVFIQDEWRATSRLTVNGGLRYDVQQLDDIVNSDTNNISPRLGVAWDVRGYGRSVLRAVAGMYYAPIPLRAVANALQRNGLSYRILEVGPTFSDAPVFPNIMTAQPTEVLSNIITIDPDIENSRSDQFSVQYEQRLGLTASASLVYEHLRGTGIIMGRNINVPTTTDPTVPNLGRPDPNFANILNYESIGDSWYDGLTVSVSRRPVKWGSARLSYTFSKGLDTTGNFFFSQPQDANDIDAERARSDNDQRHRLSLSGTFTSPAGPGATFLQHVTHGWLFSYIFTYTSKLPFNIQVANDRNGDTNFNDRPEGVSRNAGEGFDYQALDLRLSRTFPIAGDFSIEAIIDAFNVLNRANYQVPVNIITSPQFGQPTAVGDPRQIQFGLRLLF
jgi:predicted Zn-dependent protease